MVTELFFRKIRNKVNATERCSSSAYYKSQWEPANVPGASLCYTLYRWLHLLLLVTALLLSLFSPESGLPGRWPIFLTNWALILYVVQAALAVKIVTAAYYSTIKGKVIKHSKALNEIFSAFYSSSIVIALGVTIVYWFFIYDPEIHQLDLVNFTVHAGNSIIMFLDLLLVSHPVKLKNILYGPLFTLVYSIFNVIYFFCGGTNRKGNHYIYKVINWKTPVSAALFILGGMLLLVVLFIFIWFLAALRRHIANRLKTTIHDVIPQNDPSFELPLA